MLKTSKNTPAMNNLKKFFKFFWDIKADTVILFFITILIGIYYYTFIIWIVLFIFLLFYFAIRGLDEVLYSGSITFFILIAILSSVCIKKYSELNRIETSKISKPIKIKQVLSDRNTIIEIDKKIEVRKIDYATLYIHQNIKPCTEEVTVNYKAWHGEYIDTETFLNCEDKNLRN